jgi:hypothetical protein
LISWLSIFDTYFAVAILSIFINSTQHFSRYFQKKWKNSAI